MKKIFLCLLLLLTMGLSCKDEIARPKFEPTINLFFEDASCTEVWLKLVVLKVTNPRVEIKRGDSLIATYTLTSLDTTIIDENLLPSHTYTYTAQLLLPAAGGQDSKPYNSTTQCRTMDTTSHDFSFQTFTLGDGSGSSVLYDVAIISDTLAYAVGEIYQDYNKDNKIYNAAKWNGKTWELMRIPCLICGSSSYVVSSLRTIFAFNENDIWFSDGGEMIHWNGSNFTNDCSMNSWLTGAINKLWGTSSNDLYAVGNNGLIAHRGANGVWTKIESGTNYDIRDIYGSGSQILAVASNYDAYRPQGRKILSINPTTHVINTMIDNGLAISLRAIWFIPNKHYMCVGDGVFYKKNINAVDAWQMFPTSMVSNYYSEGITGNGMNDIFISGAFLDIVHFNGVTWHNYRNEIQLANGDITIKIKKDIVFAVGQVGQNAIAIIGERQ